MAMDFLQLKAFIAVADLTSFSRAAEQLHISQPAVSKRIAALEAAIGLALFDRLGHKLQLTPAGKELLRRARRMCAELDDAGKAIRNLSGSISGSLKLAASHHIGLRRLPALLKDYSAQYPQVSLELDFLDSEQAYRDIEHGSCELAIITLPDAGSSQIEAQTLWQEVLLPCAQREHPLTTLTRFTPAELAYHRAVLLPHYTFTQQKATQLLEQHGVQLSDTTSSSYLEAIAMLVTAGQGWAWLPEIMLNEEIVELPLQPALRLTRRLGVVHHRERTLSNAARAMLELLRAEARVSAIQTPVT